MTCWASFTQEVSQAACRGKALVPEQQGYTGQFVGDEGLLHDETGVTGLERAPCL